ncbi:hypothetical protein ACQU0X_26750 [Pseudovibrio ascidiaceicola]|uniref:hypothetical protein n=1 Tax=Pseudovibrio ascidiaceicola TaxID=285279 RepID=UPI003D367848
MFTLLVGVLAILLFASIAYLGVSYIGPKIAQSRTKADVSALVFQAQQISGADFIYRTENGADAAAIGDLSPEYLITTPKGVSFTDGDWSVSGGYAYIAFDAALTDTTDVCAEVTSQLPDEATGFCADDATTVAADSSKAKGVSYKL